MTKYSKNLDTYRLKEIKMNSFTRLKIPVNNLKPEVGKLQLMAKSSLVPIFVQCLY